MVDWSKRIIALEAAGWSLTDIGKEVGLTISSISDLKKKRSTEPRGMAAVKLHKLCPDGIRCALPPEREAA